MRSVIMIILSVLIASTAVIHADGNSGPMWATPSAMAVKRVSDIPDGQHQPGFLSNLDCTKLTYRQAGGNDMRTGCFTPTAFGMLDSDSEQVIFNGADEAVPLLPYANQEVLAPWPKALNILSFSNLSTGGAYLNMYDNPLAVMRDQRDPLGRLTGKQLTAAPERTLRGIGGKALAVHTQAISFSDNGSWLVVETLNGYFARVNLASLEVVPFAPAFYGSNGSEPQDAQIAISDNGRFVAVENGQAPSFKVYDLSTCKGNPTSWQAENCQGHEYWPFTGQQIAGLRTIRHPRFVNDGLLSFEIPGGGTARSGVYELAPTASITSLTDYLGLGDSYTSGEGAFDYLAGTDTKDNTCHLSANSYPLLLGRDLFGAAGGHSVACSGAVINDVGGGDGSYRGQTRNGPSLTELMTAQPERLSEIMSSYSPGYVPQAMFARQYQPRVATVSIGGNDVGFGDILERCVVPHLSRHLSDETCYNTYESRQELVNLVDRTVPRWTALYRQLQAGSPGSTVYAIGYPSIASDLGKCPLNVNLGKSELEFAEELIRYMDGAIRQAAVSAGVSYVDISQALNGHRLCEADGASVAVNGLTAGNDFGAFGISILGRESYHPNALGHQLIEQAILRQTNNLAAADQSGAPSAPDSGNLLDAPKTGRPINTLVPDNITERSTWPGQSVSIQVNGARDGLRPGSTYAVHLDGPEGPVLANPASSPDGDISESVVMPPGTAPGIHTVDIVGPDQDDSQIDIVQPVYIYGDTTAGVINTASAPGAIERVTSSSDPSTDRRGNSAGGQVLGTSSVRQPDPIRLSVGPPARRPSPTSKQGSGVAGAAAVLVVCAVLTAPVYRWRRIIKSLRDYFGQFCNN